uniref:PurM-like N-terminal domain-containing protein n=2 Tax=Tetradesmus obliquus TaxID=3088 RepID=A0A383W8S7_TETOB
MPIIDNARDFGRIAAANAINDVYAMGGKHHANASISACDSSTASQLGLSAVSPNLLVGASTCDDAAVYKINEQQAIVLTTNFFMPIIDNARDFGRIAAANAINDVYAMGGKPLLALSVLGMPINKLPTEVITEILNGGVEICKEAGIPLSVQEATA